MANQSLKSVPAEATRAELAELFGTSLQVVHQLAARGLLAQTSRGRYDTRAALASYLASLRKSAQGRAGADGVDLATERAKLTKIEAEIAGLKLEELQNRVIPAAEVSAGWTRFATLVRSFAMVLPAKVRAAIPHLTAHDQEVVKGLLREYLEDLSKELEGGAVAGATPDSLAA